MKCYFLFKIFHSKYCWLVFILSLALITWLAPKKIFYEYYSILGGLFILVSALLLTCFVRNVKERVVLAKKKRLSFLGILALVIGLTAMGTCTIGAPICGATIVGGVLALIFPGVVLNFFVDYSVTIIIASLLMQLVALYYMNCFKRLGVKCD